MQRPLGICASQVRPHKAARMCSASLSALRSRRLTMPFVFQRKNTVRPGADICERLCKRHACDLQQCLAKLPVSAATARMDISKCDSFLQRYNTCCEAAKAGEAAAQKQAAGGTRDDVPPA